MENTQLSRCDIELLLALLKQFLIFEGFDLNSRCHLLASYVANLFLKQCKLLVLFAMRIHFYGSNNCVIVEIMQSIANWNAGTS